VTPLPHDSVVLPVSPLNLTITAGASSATAKLSVTVVNADILPSPEMPGHTIDLSASTDCPGATVSPPDFDGTTAGTQHAVLLAGGKSKNATVLLTVPSTIVTLNHKAPFRCTVTFTATNMPSTLIDPAPSNNSVTVEVNVIDKNDPEQATTNESLVLSLKPIKVLIPAAKASVAKSVTVKVVNADILPAAATPGHTITVTASDGTCPTGTVGIVDYDGKTPGAQNFVTVKGGVSKSGPLALSIANAGFTTRNAKSPARCVATVTASGPAGDADASNNTTHLTIDVFDKHDY
jgi:hypothetical protein